MSKSQRAQEATRTLRRKRRKLDEAPLQRAERLPAHEAAHAAALAHATAADTRHSAMRELQQTSGNQHVQRLLARQEQETSAATAPAAPQVRDTDFGTFLVFPDDQPLSLDMAQDPKREWPISQKMADRIQP